MPEIGFPKQKAVKFYPPVVFAVLSLSWDLKFADQDGLVSDPIGTGGKQSMKYSNNPAFSFPYILFC